MHHATSSPCIMDKDVNVILRLRQKTLSLFTIIFMVCFSVILIISLLYQLLVKSFQHIFSTSLSLLIFSAIVILFLIAVYRVFSKLTRLELKVVAICLGALVGLLELAIIAFFHSILPPVIDGGHTYGEALYLLAHGHASGDGYFKIYPNNIPVTVLRYWLYRLLSIIHVSDYTIIDQTACAIVLSISIYFSWKLVMRQFNMKMANIYLLLALTCFPLFLYITYFYTDTVTLMFPVLLLYLWYLYHQSKKIRFLALLGLLLGIGYELRPNVILFLPALAIYMLLVLKLKKTLLNLIVIIVIMIGTCFSINAYNVHLGFTPDPSKAMPPTHWIMLGLSRYGEYTNADFALTFKQPTQQDKIRTDLKEIKLRIVQKNVLGLLYLWGLKIGGTYGMGAMQYDFYTRVSANQTTAYQYLFNHQKQLTLYIIQVFHIVTIFFLVLSAMNYFRTRRTNLNLLIQISLFGNFVFYTFLWESEPRYSLLFTPFMLLGAVYGFNELIRIINNRDQFRSVKKMNSKLPELAISGCLLTAVVTCAWINFPGYTQNKTVQKQYIVDQEMKSGVQSAFIDAHHTVHQTFKATIPFTHLSIGTLDRRGNGTYNLSIMDLTTHQFIFSKNFSSASIKPGQNLDFSMNKDHSRKSAEDRITIRQIRGTSNARLGLSLYGNGYDRGNIYTDGQFMENGSLIKNAVLKFQVYNIQDKPYIRSSTYFLLFSIPVLMLGFYIFVSLRRRNGESQNGRFINPI
jgi:4-amino-4-deoxy-L-arabinose transferase and related glycosyltransferases of PMT family